MTFKLLDASDAHVTQAARIWEDGWHEAHAAIVPKALTALRTSTSFVERLHENLGNTRVGVVAGKVVGFCMTHENELYQMYVSADGRGTGLAQALMADAEQVFQEQGHQSAWLACAVGNDRAARFYEKAGWRNAGVSTVNLDTSQGDFPLQVWRFEKRLA